MEKAKKLIDKIKASEKSRKEFVNDDSLSFKHKAKKIKANVIKFMNNLSREEVVIMESNEFFNLYKRYTK